MAHEPCEEASWPKHEKENIAWRSVCGGKELWVRCFHVRYFVHKGYRWRMVRLLVGAFTGPGSLSKIVTLQAPSKLQAWNITRGLPLMTKGSSTKCRYDRGCPKRPTTQIGLLEILGINPRLIYLFFKNLSKNI
jgi:hypothetical protein